jgi:maltose O-acetyltransferase
MLVLGLIVLPGVTIGEGSTIGVNSVVTKDTEQGVYVGTPAVFVKYR